MPVKELTIDQKYNCLGYFGFGNGVQAASQGVGNKADYCFRCPQNESCAIKNRARSHVVFPFAAFALDELEKQGSKFKDRPIDRNEWIRQFGDAPPNIRLMAFNKLDGMNVVQHGIVRDLGPWTAPFDPRTKRFPSEIKLTGF